ncbi:DUF1330 domain-containing protein [Streptomyces sp. NPDC014889]|uniref:DUF1330 domain-containing protein n=1 Tax=Streptomyces sp. NPDC014889 TaxID=3364928 RepID=UPI0036F4BBFA
MAEARSWYASAAYQEILRLRTDHVDGDVVLVEGVGPGYDPRERAAKLRQEGAPARTSTFPVSRE